MADTSKHGRAMRAGRTDAVESAHAEQDLKALEGALETAQAEARDLSARLDAERAAREAQEQLHRKWVLGDYSDLAATHPFEILIFTDEDPRRNHPAYVCINGDEWRIPRGIPWRVPRNVIDILAGTKVKAIQRLAQPDGSVQDIAILESRYHFQARPLYDAA